MNILSLRRGGRQFASSALFLSVLYVTGASYAQSNQDCSPNANTYGPFDYRTANRQQKALVENAHFTPGVESLTQGKTGPFGGDIGYTLDVFPNHHRALVTMERLVEKERADPPRQMRMTLDCYFERAMRFAQNDLVLRLLYANHLIKKQRVVDAMTQIEFVRNSAADNPYTQFNVGLLLFDLKDYDRALKQAHLVAAMGFTRTELRDRLVAAGKWTESPAEKAVEQVTPASGGR